MPELCEMPNCKKKAVAKSVHYYGREQRYICTMHLHKDAFSRPKFGRLTVEADRDEETLRRNEMGALGRLMYDRELSFSEKITQLDFLFK